MSTHPRQGLFGITYDPAQLQQKLMARTMPRSNMNGYYCVLFLFGFMEPLKLSYPVILMARTMPKSNMNDYLECTHTWYLDEQEQKKTFLCFVALRK
jgi:hypothetical protein